MHALTTTFYCKTTQKYKFQNSCNTLYWKLGISYNKFNCGTGLKMWTLLLLTAFEDEKVKKGITNMSSVHYFLSCVNNV